MRFVDTGAESRLFDNAGELLFLEAEDRIITRLDGTAAECAAGAIATEGLKYTRIGLTPAEPEAYRDE